MSVFEMKSVFAGYGERNVLSGIDLHIEEGEFAAVIGPNGAGKSTLLKVMAGDLTPSSGEVLFNNKSVREYGVREISRGFSVVHQFLDNVQAFTVREFVGMGRFPHQGFLGIESAEDCREIEDAMEITGISGLSGRRITDLSGGELQLVRIAHSLAQNRDVILLDEPVSHLDIMHSVGIMDILHDLNAAGSTIISVLHDINLSSEYCSSIIGIKEGRLFLSGAPADVLRYDLVEELFGTVCTVNTNPISGKPFVYPVPGHVRKSFAK